MAVCSVLEPKPFKSCIDMKGSVPYNYCQYLKSRHMTVQVLTERSCANFRSFSFTAWSPSMIIP